MLTPRFSLRQDEAFVIISIYAPFTNIGDTEIFMDDVDFRFFSKPYFLRLHLPNPIEETDSASAKYDADTNNFVVKCPKKNHGEHFAGLDMISELLKPKGSTNIESKVEILDVNGESEYREEDEDDIDCYFQQHIQDDAASELTTTANNAETCYGFGFSKTNVFSKLLDECEEILDIKDLDNKSYCDRTVERKVQEENAFSPDHYLADTFDPNDNLHFIMKLDLKWKEPVEFSKEDNERMIVLGSQRKTTMPIAKENLLSVSLGLLDILFAYCYDFRTTEGEHSPESAWTISKLCATLSCGEKYNSISECVTTGIRRSLCYPLYRTWELSCIVWYDVCDVLKYSGKKGITKILLDVIPTFLNSEGYYLMNQLYIDEYAVWCQSLSDKWVSIYLESIEDFLKSLNKGDIGLELDKLESYAQEIMSKEKSQNSSEDNIDLLEKVAALAIDDEKVDSDDSDSDQSSSNDSEASSSGSDSAESSDDDESTSTDGGKSRDNDTDCKKLAPDAEQKAV